MQQATTVRVELELKGGGLGRKGGYKGGTSFDLLGKRNGSSENDESTGIVLHSLSGTCRYRDRRFPIDFCRGISSAKLLIHVIFNM